MAMFAAYEGLDFDDVLLEPQYSDLSSRSEVDLTTKIGALTLATPIISANMDSVTGMKMCEAMANLGGLGIHHRYCSPIAVYTQLQYFSMATHQIIPSIGVNKQIDTANAMDYRWNGLTGICIDIAHGDSKHALQMVETCRKMGFTTVIAGNVATYTAARSLYEAGANVIKVGVGPGSVCTTRYVTGHGVPQFTAVLNACGHLGSHAKDWHVIADGGITNSGDIVKALAAGADAVMLGSMLAGTNEAPIKHDKDGNPIYRGMASAEAQQEFRGSIGNGTPEGISTQIALKGPVAAIINDLKGGIRSGCSYSGARNLKELKENAVFIKVNRVKAS